MRTFPASHYFEAKYPQLDEHEQEIWFDHPVHPLRCNQLGIIDFGDLEIQSNRLRDNYHIYRTGIQLGSRAKICWECYTGEMLHHERIYLHDSNPLNVSYTNLIVRPDAESRKILLDNQNEFWHNTIKYMQTKEVKLKERGIEPKAYWSMIGIPKLLEARLRTANKGNADYKGVNKNPYMVSAEKQDLIDRMKILIADGLQNKHIAAELGLTRPYVTQFRRRNGI